MAVWRKNAVTRQRRRGIQHTWSKPKIQSDRRGAGGDANEIAARAARSVPTGLASRADRAPLEGSTAELRRRCQSRMAVVAVGVTQKKKQPAAWEMAGDPWSGGRSHALG